MGTEAVTIEVLTSGETGRALGFYADYTPVDRAFLTAGMADGNLTVVMASEQGRDIGGFYLNHHPKYALYKRLGIPELQDLRVAETHRRRGIATALIQKAEMMAGPQGAIGISVGLHAGFGPAQRLYGQLGYIADGQGVTYDRRVVRTGEKLPIDNDLCLMMMKQL